MKRNFNSWLVAVFGLLRKLNTAARASQYQYSIAISHKFLIFPSFQWMISIWSQIRSYVIFGYVILWNLFFIMLFSCPLSLSVVKSYEQKNDDDFSWFSKASCWRYIPCTDLGFSGICTAIFLLYRCTTLKTKDRFVLAMQIFKEGTLPRSS